MREQLAQLRELRAELHAFNAELTGGVRPCGRLSGLSAEQRGRLAEQILARLAVWERVAREISESAAAAGADDVGTSQTDESGTR